MNTIRTILLIPVPFVGVLAGLLFVGLLILASRSGTTPSAGAPSMQGDGASGEDRDEEDEDPPWPDPWELWGWYINARMAALGHGADFDVDEPDEDAVALRAAQAIGQFEGARQRARPELPVPLLTADELQAEVERLLLPTREPKSAPTVEEQST